MHRKNTLAALDLYEKHFLPRFLAKNITNEDDEKNALAKIREFIQIHPNCYDETNNIGHITGSALVCDPSLNRVVLTLHRKLGRWLQLGGHADGCADVEQVALREAHEESGLKQLRLAQWPSLAETQGLHLTVPIDFDIHHIPGGYGRESHLHYDIRYLIFSADDQIIPSDESLDLRWFDLNEVFVVSDEKSLQRLIFKFICLKESLAMG